MALAKIFRFLRDEEHQQLLQSSERKAFKPGEVLIQEGSRQTSLYVIVKGDVKVQRDHDGFAIELSRHGPGEIFGDMSFIEGQAASATVIAGDEEVLVFIITHAHISTLMSQNPAFAARFYQSLAEILSRRLRETTNLVQKDAAAVWGNPE
ncbi:MAG TPA: cyclic nucleotide-binding domain-containing protein [Gammaproteobacteria bacterium]|jgi:CRP-like cAMP-binding protein|nr:cyclic nucleotide-binding domain-containing protein [Gammaproteobacteria bacterium]